MRGTLLLLFALPGLGVRVSAPAATPRILAAQAPQSQAENQLCSIRFDADSSISVASDDCLALLVSTLKVQKQLQLLLTGTPAHTAVVSNYLDEHAPASANSVRTASSGSQDGDVVRTSLVKPLPRVSEEMMAVGEGAPMLAGNAPPRRRVGSSAPVGASNPYSLGDQAEAWKASLQNGAIEYNVPQVMIAQQASTVTVIVHGYKDPNPHLLANSPDTVNANLKVSDMMEVDLIGSPTEFTIAPQATQSKQFVPIDGYATWIWSVTPINKASAQQLEVKVTLIPDASSGLPSQGLAQTPYTVNVTVESLWSVLGDRWHKDPMQAIEYLLPGGAGWAAIGTLLTTLGVGTWLRNKLNKPSATTPGSQKDPTPAA